MMAKSILFLLGRFDVGGVERVTVVLANEFVRRGYRVSVCAFDYGRRDILDDLSDSVVVKKLDSGWLDSHNRNSFREFVVEQNVAIVINQWCVPFAVTRFIRKATRGLSLKLIAVHHNLPTMNKRIQDANNMISKCFWKLITAINLRLVYECSDRYVLLSESFVPLFKRFTGLKAGKKLTVVTNPLTMDVIVRPKENLIVYVGRLEETQKRVSRVIEIWKQVATMLPTWKLEVVGDGPDRSAYEEQAVGLPRISFVGFKNPTEYFARAKLLLLTSDFEGFPLVLVEAMASRCVPIVLGSYPAAYDIARGGAVEPIPFNVDDFIFAIMRFVRDDKLLLDSADAAEMVKRDYGVEAIVDKWEKLFKGLEYED